MVEIFEKEKCDLFYSVEDVKAFCGFFSGLIGNPYLISLEEQVYEFLKNAEALEESHSVINRYFWWDLCNESVKEVTSDLISNAVNLQYKFPDGEHIVLLPEAAAEDYSCRNFIPIIVDNVASSDAPSLIRVQFVYSTQQISDWIKLNRHPLVMNKNNKHGENGVGGHSHNKGNKVSKLYTTIAKAQLLLDDSIADKRYSKRKRYNYDTERNKIIAFYFEGDTPQNQYHGFHYDSLEEAELEILPKSLFLILKDKFSL